ncbi:sugar transferase, partial [Luteococcus sp.]
MDAKRGLDVALGSALLLVASPAMLIAAVAVAAESPGGILFRQERVGLS